LANEERKKQVNDDKKIEKTSDPKINPIYTGPVDNREHHPEWSRMSTLLRYSMEVWKMRLFGPGIIKIITRCWHAFITEREFDPAIIFKKLDSMPSEQFILVELFEQKLATNLESYLARRTTKK
jgi:hypothetical protein